MSRQKPKGEFREEIDITDTGVQCIHIFCCPVAWTACAGLCTPTFGTKTLILTDTRAELKVEPYWCMPCCAHTGDRLKRIPYGEMGTIEVNTACNAFFCINVGPVRACPGWGCDREQVQHIDTLVKGRIDTKGDSAQIARSEYLCTEVYKLRLQMFEFLQSNNADGKKMTPPRAFDTRSLTAPVKVSV